MSNEYKRRNPVEGQKQIGLAFIGCGTAKLGQQVFEKLVGSSRADIRMYVDGKRDAYRAMGALHGLSKFNCGKCCSGTCVALWQGCTRCWCIGSSGDVEQQGAEFVMKPEPEGQVFRHIEKAPGDHANLVDFFRAAGLDAQPQAQAMQ